jgi:hypothetical protein
VISFVLVQIAWGIVHELRSLDPAARFLQKDPKTGLWNDVGDKKFREKVSQALREHQPFIKAVLDGDTEEDPREKPVVKQNNQWIDSTDSMWKNVEKLFAEDDDDESSPPATELPPFIPVEDRRSAFVASRNEDARVVQTGAEEAPLRDTTDLNLSEFDVSQGPSFQNLSSVSKASFCMGELMQRIQISEKDSTAGDDDEVVRATGWEDDRRHIARSVSYLPEEEPSRTSLGSVGDLFRGMGDDFNRFLPIVDRDSEYEDQRLVPERQDMFPPFCRIDGNDATKMPLAVTRPDIVKRGTSNQNESTETRRGYDASGQSVKRCVLSRDKSAVSSKLKQEYLAAENPLDSVAMLLLDGSNSPDFQF